MAIQPGDYQIRVTLRTASQVPADDIVNTWAVQFGDDPGDIVDVDTAFINFYQAIDTHLSDTAASSGHTLEYIHLNDPAPQVPFRVTPFTITPGGSDALPTEVALCSSFTAATGSGVAAARRRGRVFLGPLRENGISTSTGHARPSGVLLQSVADATEALASALDLAGFPLCVWSRRDDTLYRVVAGWVNNEYDTQRRRGPETTARTVWSLSA